MAAEDGGHELVKSLTKLVNAATNRITEEAPVTSSNTEDVTSTIRKLYPSTDSRNKQTVRPQSATTS